MSPQNVDIPSKGVDCSVWLRHGDHSLGLGVLEGGVALHAEADGHSEVLGLSFVGFNGSCIVVKRFPFPEEDMDTRIQLVDKRVAEYAYYI